MLSCLILKPFVSLLPIDVAWLSVERSGATFASDGHSEEARERLAMHIIAEARSGERDQCRLRDGALLA